MREDLLVGCSASSSSSCEQGGLEPSPVLIAALHSASLSSQHSIHQPK